MMMLYKPADMLILSRLLLASRGSTFTVKVNVTTL